MSTTPSPSSSATSSSTSSDSTASPSSSSNSGGGGSGSSSLYLFTFLATLFLLLCISCGIVLRSFILRRRFRQRIEDALAAGVLLTPEEQQAQQRRHHSRRRNIGEKPLFYDTWVAPDDGVGMWKDIQPISAQAIFSKPSSTPPLLESSTSSAPPSSSFLRKALRNPFSRRHPDPCPPAPPSPPSPAVIVPTRLQVSVLVAMPSREKEKQQREDESGVPDVAIGVARLPYGASEL